MILPVQRTVRTRIAEAATRLYGIAADDTVYYTDYARGMLGRLNPQTRKVEEFPSPGGAESQP